MNFRPILLILNLLLVPHILISANEIVHLETAITDYNLHHDAALFEHRKQTLYQFYTAQYLPEVQKICTTALEYFSHQLVTDKSLIIFDIDDTALYTYQWHTPATYIWSDQPHLVEARTHGRHKRAPAIQPVLDLYKSLKTLGFKIIFLSGRTIHDLADTGEELRLAGYDSTDHIILLPENHPTPSPDTAATVTQKLANWKTDVRKQLAQEYTIVGSLGDRASDFEDGYTGYQVRLPNYLY